eukprot:TRINITY_DN15605_c0_g1_i3.p2 TRINITY_DN15605_c0_g1~~TRINITY_DN15605_c0_g1_i3.p2  ORF type:complete len:293 (-),score=30.96 TRINITY_DN15605_c0_g1_i3:477-1355(-)
MSNQVISVAKSFYDSCEHQNFYQQWGGNFINVGVYDKFSENELAQPSPQIVDQASLHSSQELMQSVPVEYVQNATIVDMGAGLGGTARWLATTFNCKVHCVEISSTECSRNRDMIQQQNLSEQVSVIEGSFTNIPEYISSVDIVISQDAFVHCDEHSFQQVAKEAFRILKPGGYFLFSDIIKTDHSSEQQLQDVYKRYCVDNMGSPKKYVETVTGAGFEILRLKSDIQQIIKHYSIVRSVMNQAGLENCKLSQTDFTKILQGLDAMVDSGKEGQVTHALFLFQKPNFCIKNL